MRKLFILKFFFFICLSYLNAQDTLSGNYQNLTISKGKHIINSMVIVSNSLKVDSGAKVEFIDNGTLVCGGLVEMFGNKYDIEFYGKKNTEGVGLIINNKPAAGLIYAPAKKRMFYSYGEGNAYELSNGKTINLSNQKIEKNNKKRQRIYNCSI